MTDPTYLYLYILKFLKICFLKKAQKSRKFYLATKYSETILSGSSQLYFILDLDRYRYGLGTTSVRHLYRTYIYFIYLIYIQYYIEA